MNTWMKLVKGIFHFQKKIIHYWKRIFDVELRKQIREYELVKKRVIASLELRQSMVLTVSDEITPLNWYRAMEWELWRMGQDETSKDKFQYWDDTLTRLIELNAPIEVLKTYGVWGRRAAAAKPKGIADGMTIKVRYKKQEEDNASNVSTVGETST